MSLRWIGGYPMRDAAPRSGRHLRVERAKHHKMSVKAEMI
jgi:hypothetical protein